MWVGDDLAGRYRIDEFHSDTALEQRFLATDIVLDRKVLVGVPTFDPGDDSLIARRYKEARIAGHVWHSHLMALLDVQLTRNGLPCFIREWVDGEYLSDLEDSNAVSLYQGLECLDAISDALEVLHNSGIVHGNLKPAKILIPRETDELQFRNAKLLDVGIQILRDAEAESDTAKPRLLGTPYYMSPEQFAGKPWAPAADIFALGAMTYELAYGVPPFARRTLSDLERALFHEPAHHPSSPDVPAAIVDTIDRALAKDPAERFVSAGAFGTAVRTVLRQWQRPMYDVFISHAAEDKDTIARPLAKQLSRYGFRVWFDEFSLRVGDSLNRSIDAGIAATRYGVVILSSQFFAKEWPRRELDGLVSREVGGRKVILPIWHGLKLEEVLSRSPTLADRVAISTDDGLDVVVEKLLLVLKANS
jgi:serine/threonine protein kinase